MELMISSSDKQVAKILNQINLKGKDIADVGGADGFFLFQLHKEKRLDKDSNTFLIDISSPYLKKARGTYTKKYNKKFGFKTITKDVDELDIKGKFDIIFFKSIIEHLYFPKNAIDNLKKALKPGGLLLVLTPNKNRLNEIIKKLIPDGLSKKLKFNLGTDVSEVLLLEKEMGLKEHIHEYTFSELRKCLENGGFEVKSIQTSKIPLFVPSLCDKYPPLFHTQNFVVSILDFLGLSRFFGFEVVVLAQKK